MSFRCHAHRRSLAEAEEVLKQAIAKRVNDILTLSSLSEVLKLANKFGEAKVYLEKIIEIDSSYAFSHRLLGEILIEEKQFKDAAVHLQKVIELEPTYLPAHELLKVALQNS